MVRPNLRAATVAEQEMRCPTQIEKYLDRIREATSRPGHYAYRGQRDSEWALHSGATRKLIELYGPEILGSRSVRDLHLAFHRDTLLEPARARGFDIEHGRQLSDLEVLAKLQHFGASTGLLDFTWNPLVALWFACQAHDSDGKLFVVNTTNTLGIARVSSDRSEQTIEAMLLYARPIMRQAYCIGRPPGAVMRCCESFANEVCLSSVALWSWRPKE